MTDKTLKFIRRPTPIYPEYRPLYKIVQLLMVLQISSIGAKSRIVRLQLFNWVLKDDKRKSALANAIQNGSLHLDSWGIDPSLNVAIQFGVAEELLSLKKDVVSILPKGRKLLDEAEKKKLMHSDKEYLLTIGKGLTQKMVDQIMKKWVQA